MVVGYPYFWKHPYKLLVDRGYISYILITCKSTPGADPPSSAKRLIGLELFQDTKEPFRL